MAIKLSTRNIIILLALVTTSAYISYRVITRPPSKVETKTGTAPSAVINGTKIKLELARSDDEKTKGLGYRDSLPSDTGMLFVYNDPQRFTFWMQGMRFALDFIWIEQNKIEDIHENIMPLSPDKNPAIVSPRVPVRYILEVNSGFIKSHNIKIGDAVTFNL